MQRFIGYTFHLILPATFFLVLIFDPATLDPLIQYLAHGTPNKILWMVFVASPYLATEPLITHEARTLSVSEQLILFFRVFGILLILLAIIFIVRFGEVAGQRIFVASLVAHCVVFVIVNTKADRFRASEEASGS